MLFGSGGQQLSVRLKGRDHGAGRRIEHRRRLRFEPEPLLAGRIELSEMRGADAQRVGRDLVGLDVIAHMEDRRRGDTQRLEHGLEQDLPLAEAMFGRTEDEIDEAKRLLACGLADKAAKLRLAELGIGDDNDAEPVESY